jgi:hypothetical protein
MKRNAEHTSMNYDGEIDNCNVLIAKALMLEIGAYIIDILNSNDICAKDVTRPLMI